MTTRKSSPNDASRLNSPSSNQGWLDISPGYDFSLHGHVCELPGGKSAARFASVTGETLQLPLPRRDYYRIFVLRNFEHGLVYLDLP